MLSERIEKDFQQAFKNREVSATSTLRLLKAALKNERINKRADLDDGEVIKVLKSEIKKRKEAIEEYDKGKRPDLANKEKEELNILEKYLPPQLGEEELQKQVREILSKIEDKENFGKVMGVVMKELKDKADGNLVRKVVAAELVK